MKKRKLMTATALLLTAVLAFTGCGNKSKETTSDGKDIIKLKWYQIGDPQEDMSKVLEKVNEYTKEKIGATVEITQIPFGDYNSKMLVTTNTGENFDLAFTCSWAHDYAVNAQKGAFLALDELLPKYGKEMYDSIDSRFWDAAKINGKIYGVPNEKEIGSMPMWVFTKEYVDKYNIPYEDLHTLEDLEPYLKLIKENEPDVVPLYLTKDFSAPLYLDKIQDPLGIEYGDNSLKVVNLFETEKVQSTLKTMRRYYELGYINQDAATVTADKSVKRLVTKGDGQPYAEGIWAKDLGYPLVASQIMDTTVTNASARGSLTAISRTSKHPEKALEFLNLVNTDIYLRNLLNYGIEGVHYDKVPVSDDELKAAEGKPYIYDTKIKIIEANRKKYSVPYYVQGGMFNTYVLESEPIDKWATFKEFNDNSIVAPSFGFNFDVTPVATQVAAFQNVLNEFGAALYTGSVDPDEYIPKLVKKLEAAGVEKVQAEMQKQIDEWKASK